MALRFGKMLGGFAERGSQDIEEQRKDNQEMVNYAIQTWVTDGSDFLKTRTQKKKDTDVLVKKLENHFSPDQVGVLLNQGDAQKMSEHIDVLSKQKSEIKPDELVSMAEGYEKSGLTYAQIVERYMGKVNTGTDKDTAIMEALGPTSKYMQKRMKAAELAFGTPMQDLRALAQQDIVYEPMPFNGTVSMTDPVAVARARKEVSGTGTTANIRNLISKMAGTHFGTELSVIPQPDGSVVYKDEIADNTLASQATDLALRGYTKYAELLTDTNAETALLQTNEWMKAQVLNKSSANNDAVKPTLESILAPLNDPKFSTAIGKNAEINRIRQELMTQLKLSFEEAEQHLKPYYDTNSSASQDVKKSGQMGRNS